MGTPHPMIRHLRAVVARLVYVHVRVKSRAGSVTGCLAATLLARLARHVRSSPPIKQVAVLKRPRDTSH